MVTSLVLSSCAWLRVHRSLACHKLHFFYHSTIAPKAYSRPTLGNPFENSNDPPHYKSSTKQKRKHIPRFRFGELSLAPTLRLRLPICAQLTFQQKLFEPRDLRPPGGCVRVAIRFPTTRLTRTSLLLFGLRVPENFGPDLING